MLQLRARRPVAIAVVTPKRFARTDVAKNLPKNVGKPRAVLVDNKHDILLRPVFFFRRRAAVRPDRVVHIRPGASWVRVEHEFVIGHVPDAQQPADHLTKWVSREKLELSVAYAGYSHACELIVYDSSWAQVFYQSRYGDDTSSVPDNAEFDFVTRSTPVA